MRVKVVEQVGEFLLEKKVKDMLEGEQGYCVPWAYDPVTQILDDDFVVQSDVGIGNAFTLCVLRIAEGYIVTNMDHDYRWNR
jgi:hypothetical protein